MMGLLFFLNENLSPSADQPDDLLISYMIDVIGVDFLVLVQFFLAYLLMNIANICSYLIHAHLWFVHLSTQQSMFSV